MKSQDAVLLAQRQLYKRKLEEIIPYHPRTIEVFLTIMVFYMEQERFSMTELMKRFIVVDGKSISLPGFKRHIDLLVKHGLLTRPHYRAVEFNVI